MNDVEVFESHRPLLLGLAYRLLGSMWDAEDVVQDAYLRWLDADRGQVREPRAFLATIVSRLALDQLRSARRTREAYPGPWLPEPVASDAFGPLDTAELRDTLSFATLRMMERLAPPERAVFVLREAFDFPYETIAEVVGATVANCRQMHHRAVTRLSAARGRFDADGDEHRRLLSAFLDAARGGDVARLTSMLSADVESWNDGGGRVRAAMRPITGTAKVAALISWVIGEYGYEDARIVEANGTPAIKATVDGHEQVVFVETRDGLVTGVYAVMNPDKLTRVAG